MAGINHEIINIDVKPGERIAVAIMGANGEWTQMVAEVRVTARPDLTTNAFECELFIHRPDLCENGCAALWSCIATPENEHEEYLHKKKVQAEIASQDAAEAITTLGQELAAIFGEGSVFTMDETGLHPVNPHPRK